MRYLPLMLVSITLLAGSPPAVPKLEQAVRDGAKIKNPNAAKAGDKPDKYGSPGHGRGHDKGDKGDKDNKGHKDKPGKGHAKP